MVKKFLVYTLILFLVVLFAIPLVLTVYRSFTPDGAAFSLEGYEELLFNCFSFYPAFWNSVLYTVVITLFQILISLLAAFAFMQCSSRIMDAIFVLYIVLMMMPLQVTLLPNYIGLRDLHILDTRSAIILPMMFAPVSAVIVRQYLYNIDPSVIEAVRLETNSVFRVIVTGVFPQIRVCIAAVAIFSMAETWNMLEQPMYFLKQEELMPLSMFIQKVSGYGETILFPASVISMIPMFLAYAFFYESLKAGITLGGIHE